MLKVGRAGELNAQLQRRRSTGRIAGDYGSGSGRGAGSLAVRSWEVVHWL